MAKVRELGVQIGNLETGEKNCITDVPGVQVGHVTLYEQLEDEEFLCTGVTAILPHTGNLFREKVVGAVNVVNGFGKSIGLVQIEELGLIESPIMMTNTFSVPAVTQGTLQYMLEHTPEIGEDTGTINIVTTECNDMHLNSIRKMLVKPEHAIEAIEKASDEKAAEGAVGAGKGMSCFGFKGGIGSSSRKIKEPVTGVEYTLGVMVLSNFGSKGEQQFDKYHNQIEQKPDAKETPQGSIIMVMATDALLSDRQLKRVSKRCASGLSRTGSNFNNGSGDIIVAFSTAHKIPHTSKDSFDTIKQLREDDDIFIDLFAAAAGATEEAILNSMAQAEDTKGRKGHIVHKYQF